MKPVLPPQLPIRSSQTKAMEIIDTAATTYNISTFVTPGGGAA